MSAYSPIKMVRLNIQKQNLLNIRNITVLIILIVSSFLNKGYCQSISLWVGETYTCDASSAMMGLTANVSWTTSAGVLTLSGSGLYRTVKATQYYKGSATVKCSWKYRLYSGDSWKNASKSWTISCRENPVSISPSYLSLSPGGTAYVNYSHQFSNSYTYGANVRFVSSNTRVATVDGSGLVTAIAEGTAYINVYSDLSQDSPYCTVTVEKMEPTGVSLPASLTLTIGDSQKLFPTVTPSGAETSFTWSSDDSNIASVNASGLVTGLAAGTTKIRVTTTVGGYTDYCNVIVKEPPVDPTDVSMKKSLNLYVGFAYTLVPILQPDNAEATYIWKSDDPSVATVSTKGKVIAKKEGVAKITVITHNGLETTCEVTVSKLPANITEREVNSKITLIEKLTNKTFNKAY